MILKEDLIKTFKDLYPVGEIYKSDEYEKVIGRKKDIVNFLKNNLYYVNDRKNRVEEETIDCVNSETPYLISELKKFNDDDIVGMFNNPMSGYYTILSSDVTLEELELLNEESQEINYKI